MSCNEAQTRYELIDPVLRAQGYREWCIKLETPAPVVGVGQLSDSAISITIAPWVKVPDYEAATSEIHQAVLAAFRADGIEIPYPQRVVHLAGSPTPLSASQ